MAADPGPSLPKADLKAFNIHTASPSHRSNYEDISASIKRKFKQVKDASIARSRSLTLSHRGRTLSISPETRAHTAPIRSLHKDDPNAMDPQIAIISPTAPLASAGQEPTSQTTSSLSPSLEDLSVSELLQRGTPMIKVSAMKQKTHVFRISSDESQILWESKRQRIGKFTSIVMSVQPHSLTIICSSHRSNQRNSIWIRCSILSRAVPTSSRI